MRDPEGRLRFVGETAVRTLNDGVAPPPFLATPTAMALAKDRRLIPFESTGREIRSPRLPFVTLPTEWTDAQLYDAAILTLDIAEQVLADGYELKDASAWNVIFEGSAPIFCDHLSFQPIATPQWRAFGQYCRHFLFPLLCARRRGLHGRDAFAIERDGLTAIRARALLGLPGLVSLAAPLLLTRREAAAPPPQSAGRDIGAPLHGSLIQYSRAATSKPRSGGRSHWSRYTTERDHYIGESSLFKRRVVSDWLSAQAPLWVTDVGCNTGEFSELALEAGANVIAIDYDHDSVERLFTKHRGDRRLHPVVANMADLHGGRGWAAAEFPSLLDRLDRRADMLLMLAVVHHIHFSEAIPLEDIADVCHRLTASKMTLELIGADDPLVIHLASQQGVDRATFSIDLQLAAFSRRFKLLDRVAVPGTHRELALLEAR